MLKCSKKSSFPVRSRTRTSVVLWCVHSFLLALDLPKKEPSPNKIIGIYTLVTNITIENHMFYEDSQISPMDFPISGGFPIGKTIPRIQGRHVARTLHATRMQCPTDQADHEQSGTWDVWNSRFHFTKTPWRFYINVRSMVYNQQFMVYNTHFR